MFYVALWSINNEAQTMSLIAHNSALSNSEKK